MANMTLSISEQTRERMREVEWRWSAFFERKVNEALDDFEEAERLASRSRLTEQDALELGRLVNEGMARHAIERREKAKARLGRVA